MRLDSEVPSEIELLPKHPRPLVLKYLVGPTHRLLIGLQPTLIQYHCANTHAFSELLIVTKFEIIYYPQRVINPDTVAHVVQ